MPVLKHLPLLAPSLMGVNPQEDKRTVKKAELTLTASMNRFQVTGTKFVKVIWKDGKKTEAEKWVHDLAGQG